MALRFLEPMTAPMPAPPTDKSRSLTMFAKGTNFSPAGPIETRYVSRAAHLSVRLFLNTSSVSDVVRPQHSRAGWMLILSSKMDRITGNSAFPSMMIMSNPANLSSAPKCPRILAQTMVPESALFVTTLHEAPVTAPVPTSGPETKISLFSGPRGSVWGSTSSE